MDRIQAVLAELATCLCAQILTDNLPPVCTCGVMPGAEVALEYAGDCDSACGMAWVRLISAYPSTSIGVASDRPGNCGLAVGLDVELGVVRCVEVGDGDTPPEPKDLAAASVLQTADMMAMWRAVACCRQSKDYRISAYVPYGPQGGLVGGILPVAILVI